MEKPFASISGWFFLANYGALLRRVTFISGLSRPYFMAKKFIFGYSSVIHLYMFYRRKIAFGMSMLLLSLWGCKKEYTCGFSYYYNPAYVTFKGFSAGELKTVIVGRYTGDGSFSNLIATDTIDASAALFEGDTAYSADNYGFFTVASGVDFKIQVPLTGKEFKITEVRRFESGSSWVQDEHCPMGAGQARIRSFGFKLDGTEYIPFERRVNNWYIYLNK